MNNLIFKHPGLKTKKKKFFFPGSFINPFDPLTLPDYQAGYLMNLITDTPRGSIDDLGLSQIYEATMLPLFSLYFQTNLAMTLETINSLKAFTFKTGVTLCRNLTFDVFNGISEHSILIGFKKADNGANTNFLFYRRNAAHTQESWIVMRPNGILEILMNNGDGGVGVTVIAQSTFSYDDNQPHVLFAVFDNANKKVVLYTDLGEKISVENLSYTPVGNLAAGSFNDIHIGNWPALSLSFNPGLITDTIIYKTASYRDAVINQIFAWACNRVGITYVQF